MCVRVCIYVCSYLHSICIHIQFIHSILCILWGKASQKKHFICLILRTIKLLHFYNYPAPASLPSPPLSVAPNCPHRI